MSRKMSSLATATMLVVTGSSVALAASEFDAAAKDFVVESATSHDLSTTGGVQTTIVSVTLPSGAWVISATATTVNFGPSDYTRCAIFRGAATMLNQNATMVGEHELSGSWGPGTYLATIATTAAVKLATSSTITLSCSHDHSTPASFLPPYVDSGATLWAHSSRRLSTSSP